MHIEKRSATSPEGEVTFDVTGLTLRELQHWKTTLDRYVHTSNRRTVKFNVRQIRDVLAKLDIPLEATDDQLGKPVTFQIPAHPVKIKSYITHSLIALEAMGIKSRSLKIILHRNQSEGMPGKPQTAMPPTQRTRCPAHGTPAP